MTHTHTEERNKHSPVLYRMQLYISELEGADKETNVILPYVEAREVSERTLTPIIQIITRNEK